MLRKVLPILLLAGSIGSATVITDVRAALAAKDFRLAESHIAAYKAQRGITAEMLEAHSWLGRGALAAKQLDQADAYAAETRRMCLAELSKRALDAEKNLPIALGASIEVQAQVLAARGQTAEAVTFLRRELDTYRTTSIRTRIQKNIHLIGLEGKPAPALEIAEWLGPKPAPLASYRGKPLLLFFWAHWCGDCKFQGPILARLQQEFGPKGLTILGPTQRYGYVARGVDASPADELKYIDEIRRQHYAEPLAMPAPVSEENFKNWGASTTPTLVLVDRQGIVRMYHPGKMTYEELAPKVQAVVGPS